MVNARATVTFSVEVNVDSGLTPNSSVHEVREAVRKNGEGWVRRNLGPSATITSVKVGVIAVSEQQ